MSANPIIDLNLSEDQTRLFKIFFSYSFERTLKAATSNQRFVYYTNADTVVSIIRNKEVWMRKSSLMNDYREIEHGFDCLNAAYQNNREKIRSALDGMFPGFCARLEERFN